MNRKPFELITVSDGLKNRTPQFALEVDIALEPIDEPDVEDEISDVMSFNDLGNHGILSQWTHVSHLASADRTDVIGYECRNPNRLAIKGHELDFEAFTVTVDKDNRSEVTGTEGSGQRGHA